MVKQCKAEVLGARAGHLTLLPAFHFQHPSRESRGTLRFASRELLLVHHYARPQTRTIRTSTLKVYRVNYNV